MDIVHSYIKRFRYGRYDVSGATDVDKELIIDHKTVLYRLKKVGYKNDPMFVFRYHDRWNQNRSLPPVPTIDHNLYSIQSDNDSLLH
ncbi:hypothetical protein V1477_014468 [Vespula maculifrons]|uniref:Uncharacterized protein n=1 Tax=Vespula maculifrons TaxID=7453 RepID=A0ABD2BHI3_VESMC